MPSPRHFVHSVRLLLRIVFLHYVLSALFHWGNWAVRWMSKFIHQILIKNDETKRGQDAIGTTKTTTAKINEKKKMRHTFSWNVTRISVVGRLREGYRVVSGSLRMEEVTSVCGLDFKNINKNTMWMLSISHRMECSSYGAARTYNGSFWFYLALAHVDMKKEKKNSTQIHISTNNRSVLSMTYAIVCSRHNIPADWRSNEHTK